MNEAPRVSVVMPVRNGEAFLREALDSILAQTFRDFELIVIDDGSSDGTPAIIAEYAARDSRLRAIRQEASGLTQSLNRGWRSAAGEYVARMDADDVALPDRLEHQVEFLDGHPEVAVVGTTVIEVGPDGKELRVVRFPEDEAAIRRELRRSNCLVHASVMVRRAALEEVGGYRLDQVEDYDLWLRIAERHALANLPQPLLRYRHHPGQYSVDRVERQAFGTLAAQAAAEARRAGRPDPLDGIAALTPDVLSRLGISAEALDEAVAAHQLLWASALAEVGSEDAALQLFDRSPRSRGLTRRQFHAAMTVHRAKLAFRSGRYGRMVRLAASAVAIHPGSVFRELWRVAAPRLGAMRR